MTSANWKGQKVSRNFHQVDFVFLFSFILPLFAEIFDNMFIHDLFSKLFLKNYARGDFLLLLHNLILNVMLFGNEAEPPVAIFKNKFLRLDNFCSGCSCHCVHFLFLVDAIFVERRELLILLVYLVLFLNKLVKL